MLLTFIFLLLMSLNLLRLGSNGTPVCLDGSGLVFQFLTIWLVLFSISVLRFLTPGRIRYLLTCVLGRVFGWPLA